MAKTKQRNTSVLSQNKFAETILKIAYGFSVDRVFDDFLTMAIAACTQNPETKLSYYEEEYLQTIAYYKDSELRFEFSKAFAQLIIDMEERFHSEMGNDVLGEFFEQHISHGRNGEFFTPAPVCNFIASALKVNAIPGKENKPLRILDPACGSGRMLLAAHKVQGSGHEYYGIDINRTCAKMTALNLFLNGMWHSEVMCANALLPNDFVIAYHISLFPLGIFKIEEKEKSLLWNLQRSAIVKGNTETPDDVSFKEVPKTDATQLGLF